MLIKGAQGRAGQRVCVCVCVGVGGGEGGGWGLVWGTMALDPSLPSWRRDGVIACMKELREAAVELVPSAQTRLLQKVDALEEALLNADSWTQVDEVGQPVIKVAVVGPAHSGQQQLLDAFLHGPVGRKNPLELLTGIRAQARPTTASVGMGGGQYRTKIPAIGRECSLHLRTTMPDPSPAVLSWADAFVVLFDVNSTPSFERALALFEKVKIHRRVDYLPCTLVGVEGLEKARQQQQQQQQQRPSQIESEEKADTVEADGTLCVAVTDEQGFAAVRNMPACLTYVRANPAAGVNVNRLFHDLVHTVAERVKGFGRDDNATRVGGSVGDGSSALVIKVDDSSSSGNSGNSGGGVGGGSNSSSSTGGSGGGSGGGGGGSTPSRLRSAVAGLGVSVLRRSRPASMVLASGSSDLGCGRGIPIMQGTLRKLPSGSVKAPEQSDGLCSPRAL